MFRCTLFTSVWLLTNIVLNVQSFTPSTTFANQIHVRHVPNKIESANLGADARVILSMSTEGSGSGSDSKTDNNSEFVKADDGGALQALFEKQCDQDGLMTKKSLVSIPMIADLLSAGDLLKEELNDIWDAAPKFPDLESSSPQRIDVDSFIEIYRDIDDIFEDDDDDEDDDTNVENKTENEANDDDTNEFNTENDVVKQANDQELNMAYYSICNEAGFVSKSELMNWQEIQELIADNMLSEEEFNGMWEKVTKSSTSDQLDLEGFVAFNDALDELFVFDDEDEDVAKANDEAKDEAPLQMFYGDDLPAGVIFSELANDDFLIGMKELRRWGDLQEMLAEGDLLPIELQNIFEQIPKAPGTKDKINEEGFENLYDTIDNLFEEEETVEDAAKRIKAELVELISVFGRDEEKMPCGLDSTESEVQRILNIVVELESQASNLVVSSGGDITANEIAGNWDLLYTTSSTMKFNKGLSGLVPPNGKFGGLKQTLKASKYLADIEYIEHINAGPASFDVRVTGDWELRNSVSLFTGSRSVALSVEPDRVNYGLNSQRADHWKSLGPLNLLDIAYLDDDMRIMRGTTSTDSIFVFKRISS